MARITRRLHDECSACSRRGGEPRMRPATEGIRPGSPGRLPASSGMRPRAQGRFSARRKFVPTPRKFSGALRECSRRAREHSLRARERSLRPKKSSARPRSRSGGAAATRSERGSSAAERRRSQSDRVRPPCERENGYRDARCALRVRGSVLPEPGRVASFRRRILRLGKSLSLCLRRFPSVSRSFSSPAERFPRDVERFSSALIPSPQACGSVSSPRRRAIRLRRGCRKPPGLLHRAGGRTESDLVIRGSIAGHGRGGIVIGPEVAGCASLGHRLEGGVLLGPSRAAINC
jgi:hypothetical protein